MGVGRTFLQFAQATPLLSCMKYEFSENYAKEYDRLYE